MLWSPALNGSPGTGTVIDPLAQPAEAGLISRDGRVALSRSR